jgi:hypothetical protein
MNTEPKSDLTSASLTLHLDVGYQYSQRYMLNPSCKRLVELCSRFQPPASWTGMKETGDRLRG